MHYLHLKVDIISEIILIVINNSIHIKVYYSLA